MFEINATDLRWLAGMDEEDDLCLHGNAVARIGDEILAYEDATVSATALYLLKSLTEDHVNTGIAMLSLDGFNLIACDNMNTCVILGGLYGWPNGIDWAVIHEGNDIVKFATNSGEETRITLGEYKKAVYTFVDEIESFYRKSAPKRIPDDKENRNGYIAFWNEWHRRRKQERE